MISTLDVANRVRCEGAAATAANLKQAISEGLLTYQDFPSLKLLFECLVVDKADGKSSAGSRILSEQMMSEEAASFVTVDAFNVVASQLFFNAFTTKYNAADYTVKGMFKKIPSNLTQGETFGGISNVAKVLKPVAMTDELPTITPQQDYTISPAQERRGAIMNIGMDLMRADQTGQIMNYFETFGEAVGLTDELEACGTLADVDYNATNGANYPRTHINWKKTPYSTYLSGAITPSNPWSNLLTGDVANPLVDWNNINNAFVVIGTTLDPYTGWPIAVSGRYKLIVPTPLLFTAERIKKSVQFRSGTESSNNSILITAGDGSANVVEFDIVVSKYLHQILVNNGLQTNDPTTCQWYFGVPEQAFSWQSMIDIQMAQAIPNAGQMFTRSLAASYKCERVKTSYVFNPRYMTKNLVS
ncbi:MAG TPA: hypothetical protein VHX65_16895 [Pirellulales bacterium]|jgi:hypothetical protein|nr:hypothetical protein [Pirellulales bacterium]